jgi:hypothetical protein
VNSDSAGASSGWFGQLRDRKLTRVERGVLLAGAVLIAAGIAGGVIHARMDRATVTVATATPVAGGFIVPASAVRSEGGQTVIYVVVGDSVVRQPVVAVPKGASSDIVSAGLSSGSQVVVSSDRPLQDGQTVQLTRAS